VFTVPNVDIWKHTTHHDENIAHYTQEIDKALKTAARARKEYVRDGGLSRAHRLRDEVFAYAVFFGLAVPTVAEIPADLGDIKKALAKEAARQAKETRERAVRMLEEKADAIAAWRRGEFTNNSFYDIPTMLRVVGDNVETSRGAVFPVEHARKGLALVRAVIARGEEWKTNGHTCHLGHYQIDRITAKGTVHAGCHVVEFAEIERIAEQLA
jgi:hypothetical protein